MKLRVHFGDDSLIIEGDSLEEVRDKADSELKARNIDTEKTHCWSEEI